MDVRTRVWLLTPTFLIIAGCEGSLDRAPGILPTLVVAGEPELTIGVAEGEAPYELSGVTDAIRRSDGAVVVANCQSGELRWFDAAGRFIQAVGRRGNAPGEFTFLRRLLPLGGDTVGAYDGMAHRVMIFEPGGVLVKTLPMRGTSGFPDVLGRFSNGLFVARRFDRTTPETGTSFRTTVSLLLLDDAGQPVDSVVGLPAADVMALADRPGLRSLRLSRAAVFAANPDGVFYSGQDEAGVIAFDTALNRSNTIAPLTRPEPVTNDVKQAFQAMLDQRAHIPSGGVGPALVDEYVPMMPSTGDLVIAQDGRLWVEDAFRPGHHPLTWTAYEDEEAVARVEIPPRFFPFEFGRDWVLGVSYDQLGIERVELRRLVSGELTGRILPPRDAGPPTVPRCGSWASR